MLLEQIMDMSDILDCSKASGKQIKEYLHSIKSDADIDVYELNGPKGKTDMVKLRLPGINGKTRGGKAATIGLLGRPGGLCASPERLGFMSNGDGAIIALAIAAKLLKMQNKGEFMEGDVFISTQVCHDGLKRPYNTVPFMGSTVNMAQFNQNDLSFELDAILSVDTVRSDRVINNHNFAIPHAINDFCMLKVSNSLLDIMQMVTGRSQQVFSLSTQDITPYGNDLYHINCKLQPCTASDTAHYADIEAAARFMLEVAKEFGRGECHCNKEEKNKVLMLSGSMKHFQTMGARI